MKKLFSLILVLFLGMAKYLLNELNKLIFFIILFTSSVMAQDYKAIEKCADNRFEFERSREESRWKKELAYSEKCSTWFFKPKDCVRTPRDKAYTKEKFEYWSTIKNEPLSKKLKNVSYPNYYDMCLFDYKNNPRLFEQSLRTKWSK